MAFYLDQLTIVLYLFSCFFFNFNFSCIYTKGEKRESIAVNMLALLEKKKKKGLPTVKWSSDLSSKTKIC